MKNRFNEIKDISDEQSELNDSVVDENLPDTEISKSTVGRSFFDSVSDDELAELDANTAPDPTGSIQETDPEYTEEELKDIWDNDPGYLNQNVIHTYATEIDTVEGKRVVVPKFDELFGEDGKLKEEYLEYGEIYRNTGLHRVSWNDDAEEGTEKDTELIPGTVVDRWTVPGNSGGTYLAEEGTDFNDLHLNVSEDKREKVQYEVLKPFNVTETTIADQPFDEDVERKSAKQYKTAMDILDLVEMGYLRKIDKTEE